MPTATWNKEWGVSLNRFLKRPGQPHYGDRWGDPSVTGLRYLWRRLRHGDRVPGNLAKVRKRYLERFVTPETVALEIGSGGGRWTRYLLPAHEVIVVELNSDFFPYLEKRFPESAHKFRFVETPGYEIPDVENDSVDFVFSFGTFVHIDPEGIDEYLGEIRRVLRPGSVASIQYGDRTKKYFARRERIELFSDMNAPQMEGFVKGHAFELVEHDRKTLNHSNVVLLRKPA